MEEVTIWIILAEGCIALILFIFSISTSRLTSFKSELGKYNAKLDKVGRAVTKMENELELALHERKRFSDNQFNVLNSLLDSISKCMNTIRDNLSSDGCPEDHIASISSVVDDHSILQDQLETVVNEVKIVKIAQLINNKLFVLSTKCVNYILELNQVSKKFYRALKSKDSEMIDIANKDREKLLKYSRENIWTDIMEIYGLKEELKYELSDYFLTTR